MSLEVLDFFLGLAWGRKPLAKRVEEGEPQSYRDRSATRFAGGISPGAGLCLGLLLASCHPASPQGHAAGARPTIVSLNPCSDAILAQVTAPGQLLAISHYSHEGASSSMGVAAARRVASVSGSVEEIAALSPDVVVADVFLPPATATALRDLGIRVVTIGSVNDVAAGEAQVRDLAKAAGNIEAGEKLVGRIEQALASGAPSDRQHPISAIVWESGGIVAGDATLIADLLRHTGFVNAAAARGMRQADYLPLEAMLADPPQVILAAGDARSQEDRLLSHPSLAALKDTRRVPFDSTLLWCGGPTIVRAVDALAKVRAGLSASKLSRVAFDKLRPSGLGLTLGRTATSSTTLAPLRLSLSKPVRQTRDRT